jgi:hypothetical protein
MNPWLQILEPQVISVPARKKKERIYNGVKAGSLPCARCKVAKRETKSYCRACHNAYTRAANKRRYAAQKEAMRKSGVAAVFLDEGEYSVHRKTPLYEGAD